MSYRYLLYGAVLLLVSGCAATALQTVNTLMPRFEGGYAADIAYGEDERHRLDLFLPDSPHANRPLVVFVYGGAWQFGHRGQYRWAGESLAAMGYVTAIPDYRLFPDVRFPSFVEDVAEAIPTALAECRQLGACAGDRVVLIGHSAGAHTAAMLAMNPDYLDHTGIEVCGWIGLAGPYDFLPLRNKLEDIFPPSIDPELTQPVNFASADDPPVLLIHGKDDTRVYPENSHRLAEALQAVNVPVTLQFHADTRHAAVLFGLSGRLITEIGVRDSVEAFLGRLTNP